MASDLGRILVAGVSHRTAPVEIRERVAVPARDYPEVLARLLSWPGVDEGAVLSTCNRSEVYAVTGGGDDPRLPAFARRLRRDEVGPEIDVHMFCLDGESAVRHLFEVAAGVDSQIVGEPQILGQVREAFACARDSGSVGTVLERLFQHALEVGKKVRTETAIGAYAVSIPYAAVELARKIFGSLAARAALLAGAGEMGELTVRYLVEAGVAPVYVAARTPERVRELGDRLAVEVVPRALGEEVLAEVDVVITASGAPHTVVREDVVRQAMTRRRQRPLFLIDIAVPRNIDPSAGSVYNVFLYDIDDRDQILAIIDIRKRDEHTYR